MPNRTSVKDDDSAVPETPRIVADSLYHIIVRLQSRATIIYWTIVATLVAGVLLIIFSGYFSSFDTELLWSRLDAERNMVYSNVPAPPPTNSSAADRDKYALLKERADNAMTQYDNHYNTLLDASITGYGHGNFFNWVPIILKVSVAGLLIFLVQILIQLYRYNSLLIVFYSSRRHAILMSKGDLDATERWEAVFLPANLDFGRDPRHPFQFIANLLHRGRLSDDGSGERAEPQRAEPQRTEPQRAEPQRVSSDGPARRRSALRWFRY
jgi:hypothetical protein